MTAERVYNVLFLCTGNSARSILGEALLNHLGAGRFRGFSAGSHPKGTVHPLSLEVLEEAGVSTEGLRSKSWDVFAGLDAPKMDFVFTVCDNAAGEACPIWPGHPTTAHWGIEDPAPVTGTAHARKAAFEDALNYTRNRLEAFINLPFKSLDAMALQQQLRAIGGMAGATGKAAGDP